MFTNESKNDDAIHTAQPYSHTTVQGGDVVDNPFLVKKQPTKCKDPVFAILLYANVAAIIGVLIKYKDNLTADTEDGGDAVVKTDDLQAAYAGIVYTAITTAACAVVFSVAALQVMLTIPNLVIKSAIIFNVIVTLMAAIYGVVTGNIPMAVFGFIIFLFMLCYTRAIWGRIPFATANLKTGCAAIKANCGIMIFAIFFTAVSVAWTFLWSLTMAAANTTIVNCQDEINEEGEEVRVCDAPKYGYLFLFLVSFFFTNQVIGNCVHTTVAGTVGSWWFTPSSSGCCGVGIWGSFIRTMTTSFGSICFGSLLVALVQATRQLAEMARQNGEMGPLVGCVIDCILGCLEAIIEYFNKWAFVYVGLYGYGYFEAGKSVMQLFRDRGWDAIVADDLVSMVISMTSIVCGLITGVVALVLNTQTSWFDDFENGAATKFISFLLGFIIGFVISNILLSVVGSAVNTAIVCFAESPEEFEKNYPELSKEMRDAWTGAFPGCFNASYAEERKAEKEREEQQQGGF